MLKFIPIAKPYIDSEDKKAIQAVLNSGRLSLGPKYKEFEKNLAERVKAKYACAVANGTAGLHLAVRSLDIHDGDEVITTPFSFIASSNCLLFERAKPIFVDIEEQMFTLNPRNIEQAITKKTKAILVVHIFGQAAQMDKIMRVAAKHHLKIIEDACESLGAYYKGRMTGTFGDIGIYSFYPNKQMTTGEGAMIVTGSKKIYDLCSSMRNQGRKIKDDKRNKDWDWLTSERLGYNYRLDEMSAALGVTQLKKLDWLIGERKRIVGWYNEALANLPGVLLPQIGQNRKHSWFLYVVRITNGKRDQLMSRLTKIGIEVRPYFPAIHLQPFMKQLFGYKEGDFPVCEKIASQTLALPLYIGLKKSEVQYIASQIRKFLP